MGREGFQTCWRQQQGEEDLQLLAQQVHLDGSGLLVLEQEGTGRFLQVEDRLSVAAVLLQFLQEALQKGGDPNEERRLFGLGLKLTGWRRRDHPAAQLQESLQDLGQADGIGKVPG